MKKTKQSQLIEEKDPCSIERCTIVKLTSQSIYKPPPDNNSTKFSKKQATSKQFVARAMACPVKYAWKKQSNRN
jgi:hypothetical protein